jgi:hypothetical protein
MEWWEGLKYIIDTVQPIYKLLRFADRPKLCDVVYAVQICKTELEYLFGTNVSTYAE